MRNLIAFSDTTDKSNVSVDALMMREYIKFQTLANLENSQRMLSYTFPKNNEFVKIEQSNSRSYIFAIVLALVAGFFTIIVLKKIGGPRN
jgi:secreted Zn-dependent insulinase-like peptidase